MKMVHPILSLLLLLSSLLVITAGKSSPNKARGLDPRIDLPRLLQKKLIRCDQALYTQAYDSSPIPNSTHTISLDQLNDNFCDCPESGIDETSTNACNKGWFYCASKFALEKHVHSSKINDGVCDCCDCSDEFEQVLPGKPGKKADTCFQEFKEYIERHIRELKDTVELKARYAKEKQDRDREIEIENQALKAESQELLEKLDALKAYSTKMVDTSLKEQHFSGKKSKDSNYILTEFVNPQLEKHTKRLKEVQKKFKSNSEYMRSGIVLIHLRKREFNEMIEGRRMVIRHFQSIDYVGRRTNLGNFAGILSSSKEVITAFFEGGSDCGGGKKKRTIVDIICGNDENLGPLKKSDECNYKLIIKTPFMCTGKYYKDGLLNAMMNAFN